MKKFLLTVVLLFSTMLAFSQTRAVGFRAGYGAELSYQHSFSYPHFLEVDLGMDMAGANGFKFTGTYNWIVATPFWTSGGEWNIYLGPGASLGYVYNSKNTANNHKANLMTSVVLQVGIEYCIWEHLALSADIRPMLGFHFGTGTIYKAGMYGFIPALALRYKF